MMTRSRQTVVAPATRARFATSIAVAVCSAFLVMPTPAAAGPAEDAYVAGYVTAVLERQMDVKGGRITVKDGVVTVEVPKMSASDRERIVATLSTLPGVSRVMVVDLKQAPETTPRGASPATLISPAVPGPAV